MEDKIDLILKEVKSLKSYIAVSNQVVVDDQLKEIYEAANYATDNPRFKPLSDFLE